jgi:hypothetical protein
VVADVTHDGWSLVGTLLGDKTVDPFYWAPGELPLDARATRSTGPVKIERLGADATRPHRVTYRKLTRD